MSITASEDRKSKIWTNRTLLWVLFVLLYSAFLFIWAYRQPFNSSPDERMRYVMPKYIYDTGKLPRADDPTIVDEKYGHSYAGRPVLSYLISVICMKSVSLFDDSEWALLMAARFGSIICGGFFAIFVILISKEVFQTERKRWFFTILTCLWPQCAFMFTYVNCDALALMSVAMIILFWIRGYKDQFSISSCIGLGIAIGIGAQSYYNMYGFIACSLVVFFARLLAKDDRKDWKYIIGHGLVIAGIAFALAGWFFIRNAILYNGDFTGNAITLAMGNQYGEYGARPMDQMHNAKVRFETWEGIRNWVLLSAKSFIGCFGYMSISLPLWAYALYMVEIIAGCIGYCIRIGRKEIKWNCVTVAMCVACVCTFALDIYYNTLDYQPQGRYLLPMLIPLCIAFSKGMTQIKLKSIRYGIAIVNIAVLMIIPILCY